MILLHVNILFGTSLAAQTVKHLPTMRETQVQSLGQEDPLEKEIATHSSILAWKIARMEGRSRLHPWGHKELDMTEQLHFHLQSSLPTSIYWIDCLFSIEYSWLHCQILVEFILRFTSGLFILFHWSICHFCASIILFDCYSFMVNLKSGSMMPLTLLFFLRMTLAILGLLWSYINFRIFFYFWKNAIEILIEIALNL